MATPVRTPNTHPTRPSGPKPFNPNKTYPVRLAERLKKANRGTAASYTNASIQVDPSIKIGATVVASSIEPSDNDPSSLNLSVTHRNQAQPVRYPGTLSNPNPRSTPCTLTFDPATQTLILDRIDAQIAITSDGRSQSPNGPGARSHSANSDANSIGSADPNNPFDWRHQYQKRKSSSPEANEGEGDIDFDAATIGSDRDSPAPARKRSFRKASTPPDGAGSAASSPARNSDFELELEFEPERPSARAMKPKPLPRRMARSPTPPEREAAASDDDGDLVIELEQPTRGRGALSTVFGEHDRAGRGAPRSLASVASSRSRSRQPLARKPLRNRERDSEDDERGFEIDFDNGNDDGDDGGMELANSPPAEEDEEEDEVPRMDSDVDVSEIEVGSPVHQGREGSSSVERDRSPERGGEEQHRQQQQQQQQQTEMGQDDAAEFDDEDDMMEAFKEAFEHMEGGDEDAADAAGAEQGYESEVSEAD